MPSKLPGLDAMLRRERGRLRKRQSRYVPGVVFKAELREAIYRDVSRDIEIEHRYNLVPEFNSSKFFTAPEIPGLLFSCKQIHFEAIRTFYSTAIFQFNESVDIRGAGIDRQEWLPPKSTESWLLRIGKERARHVRRMRIHVDRRHGGEQGVLSLSVSLPTKKEVFEDASHAVEVLASRASLEINVNYGHEVCWVGMPHKLLTIDQ